MKFPLIVIGGFPGSAPQGKGSAWTMVRSAKQLPLLSARLHGPADYLGYKTSVLFKKDTNNGLMLHIDHSNRA